MKKLYDQDFRNVVNNLPAVKKSGQKVGKSALVAWIAILIDYAELPVMYDTAKKTVIEIKKYLEK